MFIWDYLLSYCPVSFLLLVLRWLNTFVTHVPCPRVLSTEQIITDINKHPNTDAEVAHLPLSILLMMEKVVPKHQLYTTHLATHVPNLCVCRYISSNIGDAHYSPLAITLI